MVRRAVQLQLNRVGGGHTADHTRDSHSRALQCFLDNLARYERGETLVNVVDKRAGY